MSCDVTLCVMYVMCASIGTSHKLGAYMLSGNDAKCTSTFELIDAIRVFGSN